MAIFNEKKTKGKSMKTKKMRYAVFFILAVLLMPQKVYGYIDPGTGSMVIQVVVAIVLGAGVALRIFWSRITGLFFRKKHSDDEAVFNEDESVDEIE
jgi:quinol-cytochrome oxidoreductase complex cytochrome b subunit